MRPPSPEVVAAVEQAMLCHAICDCLPDSATRAEVRSHVRVEVARATEVAALRAAADECEANAHDWYGTDIFRDVDMADLVAVRSAMQAKGKDIDNLSAWYFRQALTIRADILRRMADELTNDEQSQSCELRTRARGSTATAPREQANTRRTHPEGACDR